MSKLRVGMVGLGNMGGGHVRCWRRMDDVELVAGCDIRTDEASKKLEGTGAVIYSKFEDMLKNEKLDILDICTPSFLHKEQAIAALSAGINVVSEKPAALSHEDAAEIVKAAKTAKYMVAHVIRFWPEYVYLKKVYDEKTYGSVIHADFWRIGSKPGWSWENWFFDEKRSGLVPFDLQIHDVDFMVSMFGMPETVSAERVRIKDQIIPDHIMATYNYGGFTVRNEASWFQCAYPFSMGFRVVFEKAILEFDKNVLTVYEEGAQEGVRMDFSSGSKIDTGVNVPSTDAYYNELRYFADCVSGTRQMDAFKPGEIPEVIRLVNEGKRSADEGIEILL